MEKPALKPLPEIPYVFAEWRHARVGIDCHIDVEGHFYSVPYALVKKKVEARYTAVTVEILFKGNRVASHLRSYRKGKHTTTPEHMPSSHRRYAEWTPQRILRWAAGIRPEMEKYVAALMESHPHPEQGFRAALGIMRLAKQYGKERIEAACKRASAFRLDDWGLAPLENEQRRDLLEILDDRHGTRSTLVTSQLPIDHWHEMIGDATVADAILDRLVHNAHKIKMRGESMRKRKAGTKESLTETDQ